ncbi:MAG TPA: hypothetical protein VFC25_12110 [Verrucomicrobiae bacterium]|nr:hypothetical protein [Verrucomicrobiae bacterium]
MATGTASARQPENYHTGRKIRPAMDPVFQNAYDDNARAKAYAGLEFPGTYWLAFRDLPAALREHVRGTEALDFGCGTRFELGWADAAAAALVFVVVRLMVNGIRFSP